MELKTNTKTETSSQTKEPPGTQTLERSNFIINKPFRGREFAANKPLADADWEKLESAIASNETLKFVIVGDLNLHSKYAKSKPTDTVY